MKKIRSLPVAVYIVFGLFVPQNVAAGARGCFKQRYSDGINLNDNAFSLRVKLKEERSLTI